MIQHQIQKSLGCQILGFFCLVKLFNFVDNEYIWGWILAIFNEKLFTLIWMLFMHL